MTMTAQQLIAAAAACAQCGKEHTRRKTGAHNYSWADPKDGHDYRPKIGDMLNGSGSDIVGALRALAFTAATE